MTYKDNNLGVNTVESTSFRKFRLFWAWQDHEEEAWLRQMAQQGYHLSSLVFSTIYEFTVGEPRDVVYRLDYTDVKKNEVDAYLQLFEDAGWEYLDGWAGWYYFRKPADSDKADEIYTDAESKIQKYQRMLVYFIIFNPILFGVFLPQIAKADSIPLLNALIIVVMLLYIYATVSIIRRIQQLKRL
jgi:hypothetical protein